MILQALKEYYDRKANEDNSGIAPLGWERKEIPFLLVITSEGKLVHVSDMQEIDGKKKRAKSFLVPKAVKRSSGIASNLLWDNVEYATGIVCKGKPARVAEQHKAFLACLQPFADCPAVASVIAFLKSSDMADQLRNQPVWKEASDVNAFISFQIAGHDTPVFGEPEVVRRIDASGDKEGKIGICLISGNKDTIANLHSPIKGVRGANSTGANIVSFNSATACSFGKEQGENAPVGEKAAFEYTTALNVLLGKDSRQKLQVGDATTVFWASRPNHLEDEFVDFFDEPPKDDPDKGTAAVESLLKSVHTGAFSHDDEEIRFYVLGLSPNAARIAIRFWHAGTVAEMERRFAAWFEELHIVHNDKDRDNLSLWRLLVSLAPQGKSENIPPNLAGAVMRSILDGTPYPATLLSSALARVKAEREITYPRAQLLKASLIRNHKRNITMSLDKSNTDVGYRLGRLFALLEGLQQAVAPSLNATIRDRFYASASVTPAAVFGNLMRLSNHHLAKLGADKKGLQVWFEQQIAEIMSGIASFPPHLALEQQGMFAIGYYHQRAVKKESTTSAESNN